MKHKKNKIIESIRFFWERILSLPFGRRLIFFSATLSLIFLFFPWFFDGQSSGSAFEKTMIFGGLLFLISSFTLLLVLREIFSHQNAIGPFSHNSLFLFLFGQGMYTVILANSALSVLAVENNSYDLRIGVMLTFLAFGIGLAGAVFSRDFVAESGEKKQVFVDKDVDLSGVEIGREQQLSLGEYEEK